MIGLSTQDSRRIQETVANGSGTTLDRELTPETEVAVQLSELVYLPADQCREILQQHGFDDFRFVSSSLGTEGLCATRGGSAFICFRGTKQLRDLVVDFLFWPCYRPLRHFGFGRSWRSVEDQVAEWLDGQRGRTVHFSGHSLGGAIATVAAYELSDDVNVGSLTTFGGPRVFFFTGLSRPRDRLSGISQRFVNSSDIVPRALPALLGYRHLGRQRSAADPDAPSVVDKMLQVMNGLSNTALPHEPHSKQLARTVIGLGLMLFAPVHAVLFGVLIGTSLLTGAFRSGQNHARRRYVDNLGLEPLRTEHQRQIERQAQLFSRRRRPASIRGEELLAAIVLALAVGTAAFIYVDTPTALLGVLYVLLAVPALNAAAWFATHPDPVGHVWNRSGKPPFQSSTIKDPGVDGPRPHNSVSMARLRSRLMGEDVTDKREGERDGSAASPVRPRKE